MSQYDLADRSGVAQGEVSRIERGLRDPKVSTLEKARRSRRRATRSAARLRSRKGSSIKIASNPHVYLKHVVHENA
jgi:transcriptional regulator with XRE-family HTH domain